MDRETVYDHSTMYRVRSSNIMNWLIKMLQSQVNECSFEVRLVFVELRIADAGCSVQEKLIEDQWELSWIIQI